MKVTPSAEFIRVAGSPGVVGRWRVYARTVTDISESPSSGTAWTELSSRIAEVPEISTGIEYEVGQFSTDAVTLTFYDIRWFKTNIFPSATLTDSTKYVEFKVTYAVDGAADEIPMFIGFADKEGIEYSEVAGTVVVPILTAQDIGFGIAAENLATQYRVYKIDGTNDGLRLLNLPGVYVTNAALSSYELKVGSHKIAYVWDGAYRTLSLDDGNPAQITANGNYDLANADGDQKIRVHIPDYLAVTGNQQERVEDEVVVVAQGTTLPKQWPEQTGIQPLIRRFFSKIGINTVNFGALTIPSETGSAAVSFVDSPPEDDTYAGDKTAIAVDNDGNVWIGVGNRLYVRNRTTDLYTLKATLATGDVIQRMYYNYRGGDPDDIWMYIANGSTIKVGLYDRGRDHLYTSVTVSTAGPHNDGGVHWNSCAVLDYNYTGSSYKYAFLYTVARTSGDSGYLKQITKAAYPSTTLTAATIWSNLNTPVPNGEGFASNFLYIKSGNSIRYQCGSSTGSGYEATHVDATGAYVADGLVIWNASFGAYNIAAYHPTDDRIYYYDSGLHGIKSHPSGTYTLTTNMTMDADPPEDPGTMYYGNGKVYFTTIKNRYSVYVPDDNYLWSFTGNPGSPTFESTGPMGDYGSMAYNSTESKLYGLARNGMLWVHASDLEIYVRKAEYSGSTVTDAIYDVMKSFGILATINAAKEAYVYRRADNSGNPVTTGQSLDLTEAQVADITESIRKFPRADLVEVAGFSASTSYNGTSFDITVLTDAKVVSVESRAIPDELVRPLAKYFYAFFSQARTVYKASIGVPFFHYEAFDGADFALTTTNIPVSASGPIYRLIYKQGGTMEGEVLV